MVDELLEVIPTTRKQSKNNVIKFHVNILFRTNEN